MRPPPFGAARAKSTLLLVYFRDDTNNFGRDTNKGSDRFEGAFAEGQHRPYKVGDGEGLYVFVSTSGARLWRLAYRFKGKQKTLSLGKYPETSLLDARRARDEAKKLIANEIDPSGARKRGRAYFPVFVFGTEPSVKL